MNFNTYPQAPIVPALPVFFDDADPGARSRTDNKASVAITDLLEKPHGKFASNLNEARRSATSVVLAAFQDSSPTQLITAAAKENQFHSCRDILEMATGRTFPPSIP